MARWTDEAREAAAGRLVPAVYEYFRQGAEPGPAAAAAEAAWAALRLRPHVLRDVAEVELTRTVLGRPVATPVLVGPAALQDRADPAGAAAVAAAVAEAGSLLCLSSSTAAPYKAVAATGARWWAQTYVLTDRGLTREMVLRARDAGAEALVLTVDTPLLGNRPVKEAELAAALPGEQVTWYGGEPIEAAALRQAPDLTAADVTWLRDVSGLPVLLKGVLRGDDAAAGVAAGAAGVIVSNHGGRQLDTARSTASALPEVVAALAGTGADVLVDGGLRRGEQVLAALALGAAAVLVTRPVLWALAVDGTAGVLRLLAELTGELRLALALAGVPRAAELTADLVAAR